VAQNPIVALIAFVLFLAIPLYRVATRQRAETTTETTTER
jgi:hypothetical protein